MTKIGRRRNRNEGVQWLMIGLVLGMACSFTVGFAGYVFGLIEFSSNSGDGEPEVQVVTSTIDPSAPIQTPTTEIPPIIQPPEGQITEEPAPIATFTPTNLPDGSTESPTEDLNAQGAPTDPIGTPPPTGILPGPPTSSVPSILAAGASLLLPVQGGSFTMGTTPDEAEAAVGQCIALGGSCDINMTTDSDNPHTVTLDNFMMEQYEVSVIQYVNFLNYLLEQNPGTRPHLTVCGGAPCALTSTDTGGEASDITFEPDPESELGGRYVVRLAGVDRSNYPVTLVTWYGADAYCKAIGRYLPTEAQWERAARGLANSIYPWGPNWEENRAKTNRPVQDGTVPIDSYGPGANSGLSEFSIFNMAGNVAEWTADWFLANYYELPEAAGPNPRGPVSGTAKVVRGGSWSNPPLFARTVHRIDTWGIGDASTWVGFRCADDAVGGNLIVPTSNTTITNPTPDTSISNPSGLGDKTGSGTTSNTTPVNNPPINIPPTATLADGQ